MTVKLLHHTPLWVADKAIGKCWNKPTPDIYDECCETTIPGCNIERIKRVALKNKHGSTVEHLNYTYNIDGMSRALLQELVRHRHCSYSVKSTRYTLKELKDIPLDDLHYHYDTFLIATGEVYTDCAMQSALEGLHAVLNQGVSNDIAKYCLPEAFKTSLVMTINARSLQNLLQLRTHKSALWEFRKLAKKLYEVLPEDHKFLFIDFIYKGKEK